jgi:PTS system nitrogen regulatory IIA component
MISLSKLLRKGGVYPCVNGGTPSEVLADFIGSLNADGFDKSGLLAACREREELTPTAIGHGIALPHPRNPVLGSPADAFVAVGYLARPIDWHALDRQPVKTAILLVSPSPKIHLRVLSQVNYCCAQTEWRGLLEARAPVEELVGPIEEMERIWAFL